MAKKEKKKDYSAGNGKKWIFVFASIALVAIVIVVLLLAIPPNTNNAVNLLNKASANSYMKSYTESTQFDNFESKVKSTQKLNDYITDMPTEMADVQKLSVTIWSVLDFYNDNIIFATKNGALSNNYKSIMNGLNGALQSQRKLNDIIDDVNNLSNNSPTYLQSAWIEFRAEFVEWLGYNKKAIEGLKNSYQNGLGNTTNNNLASTITLNVVSDYIDVIYNDFKAQVKLDAENPNASTLNYVSAGKIDAFYNFTLSYVDYNYEIREYYFQSNIKEKYKLLYKFYEIYQEPDFKNVLSSITKVSGVNVITKTYENITDENGVYNQIKTFVVGG